MGAAAPDLRSRLSVGLRQAMKHRDAPTVSALRTALAAISNAEAVAPDISVTDVVASEHIAGTTAGLRSGDVAPRMLEPGEVRAIVRHEVDERLGAAENYEAAGRPDEAGRLRQEAAALESFLHG